MDSDQTVRIPLEEYNRLHELDLLESKQEMYEQSQAHTDNLQHDLDRYKEKHAQLQKQLTRTQKQLDRFLNLSRTKKLGPASYPVNVGPAKETEQDDQELISREPCTVSTPSTLTTPSHGHLTVKSNLLSPNTQEPIRLSHSGNTSSPQESHLHSISADLVDYSAPGVSMELLRRLVKDNLRMKQKIRDLETCLGVSKKDKKSQSSKEKENMATHDSFTDSGKKDNAIESLQRNMDATLIDQYKKEHDDLKSQLEQTSQRLSLVTRERNEFAVKNRQADSLSMREEQDKAWKIRQSLSNQLKIAQEDKDEMIRKYEDLKMNFEQLSHKYKLLTVRTPPARPKRTTPHTAPIEVPSFEKRFPGVPDQPPALRERVVGRSASSTPPAGYSGSSLYATGPLSVTQRRAERPNAPLERSREVSSYRCPKCDEPFLDLSSYKTHIQVCLRTN